MIGKTSPYFSGSQVQSHWKESSSSNSSQLQKKKFQKDNNSVVGKGSKDKSGEISKLSNWTPHPKHISLLHEVKWFWESDKGKVEYDVTVR